MVISNFTLLLIKVLQQWTHSTPRSGQALASKVINEEENEMDQVQRDEEYISVECVGLFSNATGEFNWAASGGMDSTMKIWDFSTGACRCSCVHEGSVVALKWHPSLPAVITCSLDNKIRVWDARSGTCVLELTGHENLVTNLDFISGAPNDNDDTNDIIVSVSDDGTARVFLLNTSKLLAAL